MRDATFCKAPEDQSAGMGAGDLVRNSFLGSLRSEQRAVEAYPRPRRNHSSRTIRLHGVSASVAAAAPRPASTEYPRRGRGAVAAPTEYPRRRRGAAATRLREGLLGNPRRYRDLWLPVERAAADLTDRRRGGPALDELLDAFLAATPRSVADGGVPAGQVAAGVVGGELYARFKRRMEETLAGAADDAAARERRALDLLRELRDFALRYDGFPRPPPGRPHELKDAMCKIDER